MIFVKGIIGHCRPHFDALSRRIYFKNDGAGIPLVSLLTAGADSWQDPALLNDETINKRIQVIVPDLP